MANETGGATDQHLIAGLVGSAEYERLAMTYATA